MIADGDKPSLVIVDDHQLFREGLQALLVTDFDIVGVGSTSLDAIRLCEAEDPDLLLLDVELASDPAETTIRSIRRNRPGVTIVILTMFDEPVLRRQLLLAGASEYLTKSIDHQRLTDKVRRALLSGPAAASPGGLVKSDLLSPRESEVLRLVAAAASNREISLQLSISEGTVKRHVANIYLKIGAVSRVDAVTKAKRFGLLRD